MLSIVIPVLNEIATLPAVVTAVSRAVPGVPKEILLIDDGSTDGTREWMREQIPHEQIAAGRIEAGDQGQLIFSEDKAAPQTVVRTFFHEQNQGKGAGLRTGFAAARGDVIVVQDADLEYDPADWQDMYALIAEQGSADVVYGSRFKERERGGAEFISFSQWAANRVISSLFGVLYGERITDVETCYKMFKAEVNRTLDVTCRDFGCEIQISAQIARARRWRISELPISYRGRTYEQGKKINWRDGLKALWYLVRFRASTMPESPLVQADLA